MSKFSARHGDIYLEQVNGIPKDSIKRESGIILSGGATGHAHKLVNGIIFDNGGTAYIQTLDDAAIVHEEHNTIELPIGSYVVIRQIEYNPYEKATREVLD